MGSGLTDLLSQTRPPNPRSQVIHGELAKHFTQGKGGKRFRGAICVQLWESHKAWACYEAEV